LKHQTLSVEFDDRNLKSAFSYAGGASAYAYDGDAPLIGVTDGTRTWVIDRNDPATPGVSNSTGRSRTPGGPRFVRADYSNKGGTPFLQCPCVQDSPGPERTALKTHRRDAYAPFFAQLPAMSKVSFAKIAASACGGSRL